MNTLYILRDKSMKSCISVITYHFKFSLYALSYLNTSFNKSENRINQRQTYSNCTKSVGSGKPLGFEVTDQVHAGASDAAPPPGGVSLRDGQHGLVEVHPDHLQPLLHQHPALLRALDLEAV